MERNHWSSWTRKTLSEPNSNMDDWVHSDERMRLRQEVFLALTSHLNQHCRHVYEFCNIWRSISSPGKEFFKAPVKFSHDGNSLLMDKIIAPDFIFPLLKSGP